VTTLRSVLICGVEPGIKISLKNKLKELGFEEILECCDDELAVETAYANPPNIAILNVVMSRKDCLRVAREIRQKLKIPILLLTACCDQETLKRAIKIGITAILVKPFRGQDLWPAIEMAFAHNEEVEILKENVKGLSEVIESRKIIDKAKTLLIRSQGLYPFEAFRKIQKLAVDKQTSMRQIAEAVLLTEG
jgi:AmiR/NasT family two-component response regulator